MTGTLSFCTGTVSVDPVYLCQHWTKAPTRAATAGGAVATSSSKAKGAHWPVATGGMVAAAVGVAGMLL
jgi:hypothetical protein